MTRARERVNGEDATGAREVHCGDALCQWCQENAERPSAPLCSWCWFFHDGGPEVCPA